MDLQYTLQDAVLQLKNTPRTLVAVAAVVQKIMKTLYDAHFPDAENRRPGRNPVPTATFSRSDGCLNTSQKIAKTRGIPV